MKDSSNKKGFSMSKFENQEKRDMENLSKEMPKEEVQQQSKFAKAVHNHGLPQFAIFEEKEFSKKFFEL